MSDAQKQPSVALWTTVVVVAALVVYPLSIGPVTWAAEHFAFSEPVLVPLRVLYTPIIWGLEGKSSPPWLSQVLHSYVELWSRH